jgi:hypothetical protein
LAFVAAGVWGIAILVFYVAVDLLGHESEGTTLNHYVGLFPTDLDNISDSTPRRG